MTLVSSNLDKYILQNAKIYHPDTGKFKDGDLLIIDGKIKDTNYTGELSDLKSIDCSNYIISPGFLDLRTHLRDPGNEDIESINSGSISALAGGYTRICMLPDTNPCIDTLDSVFSIKHRIKKSPINIELIGSATKNLNGEELSEIGLMSNEGIVAISDAHKIVKNSQLIRNILEYSKMFKIPFFNHTEDYNLANNGFTHESRFSTEMGLPANPYISETVALYTNIEIAKYVKGLIHIPNVSSEKSVEIIKYFKTKYPSITADVSPHHLGLNQEELVNYDSTFKISPPLRTKTDNLSLIEGLRDGTIDCIASDHFPRSTDTKESDLLNSKHGVIGLESAFPFCNKILSDNKFNSNQILNLFTKNPSETFNIHLDLIKEGEDASLNIIDMDETWTFTQSDIFSQSHNTAMIGKTMKGKIKHVLCKNKIHSFI